MKNGGKNSRSINRIEFSKEFLAEFGLLPSGKEALPSEKKGTGLQTKK